MSGEATWGQTWALLWVSMGGGGGGGGEGVLGLWNAGAATAAQRC